MSEADEIAASLGLEPLPAEGGRFRRTWAGPPDASGRPAGSAIMMMLTAEPGDFSALHRLPIDEVWHFYRGDALELVLLHPDGRHEVRLLGGGAGQPAQSVVPAGTWMGARVAPGGAWSLFGTTMAPGFVPADYEGGEVEELVRGYPECEGLIRALCRADGPRRMPGDLHGGPDGDLDGDLDGGDSVRAAE